MPLAGSREPGRGRVRRARSHAALRAGTSRRAARRARAAAWSTDAGDSASDWRPRMTTRSPLRPVEAAVGRLLDGAAARRGAVAGERVLGELLGDRARFAGSVAQHRATSRSSPVARGAISTTGTWSSTAAWRTRRCRTGSSSLRSGASRMTPRARSMSAMVARGRPSTTSAGRPSPSWASTLSVPSTPLARRAHV